MTKIELNPTDHPKHTIIIARRGDYPATEIKVRKWSPRGLVLLRGLSSDDRWLFPNELNYEVLDTIPPKKPWWRFW